MTNTVSAMISDETLNKIITIESAGNPRAKAATSSATGLFQFISATWMTMVQRYRPEWMEGRTKQQVLDLRLDARKNIEMGTKFTEENAKAIPGEHDADGDLYLAHFAGVGVARQLFKANPNAPAETIFSAPAVAANRSIIQGKTVGEVRAWAEKKMRQAGGRKWIEKYWQADDTEAEIVARQLRNVQPPAEASPETEWTYPQPKKEGQGVEGAAQLAGGLTLAGVLANIWDNIDRVPDSAWGVVTTLAAKPQFYLAVGVMCAVFYGIYRWRKFRREADA